MVALIPLQPARQLVRVLAASLLLIGCGTDGSTAPPPAGQVVIAPLPVDVYEGDVVTLAAVVRDRNGQVVEGAPVTWSLGATGAAELAGNQLTLLRSGSVSITATSGSLSTTQTVPVRRLNVLAITVGLTPTLPLKRGDIAPLGVRAEGEGGRLVLGRSVVLSSDDPTVALIDPSGRVRAVGSGVTTIRATIEGVSGSLRIEVAPEDVTLVLSQLGETRLPALAEAFTVDEGTGARRYELWMEGGEFSILTSGTTAYSLSLRQALYEIVTVNGQPTRQLVSVTTKRDDGAVEYDARGDLLLRSGLTGGLTHTAGAVTGGFRLRYREPGDDLIRDLFYRREPS